LTVRSRAVPSFWTTVRIRRLLISNPSVVTLFPDEQDEFDRRKVATLVVGNIAYGSVEGHARMHRFRDFLRIERLHLLRCLFDDLDAGVGIERVGFRIEVLRLELGDDVLRRRIVARVGSERHQGAFDAGAADLGELVVADAVAGDHDRVHAPIAHVADDEAAFGLEPAPHQIARARLLDLGDDRGIVLLGPRRALP